MAGQLGQENTRLNQDFLRPYQTGPQGQVPQVPVGPQTTATIFLLQLLWLKAHFGFCKEIELHFKSEHY